jgi:competence protein ComEA
MNILKSTLLKPLMAALWLACVLGSAALPPAAHAQTPVNINTADAATLAKAMDGVGQSKAQAIVDYRVKNGPFRSIDDLALVKGIGTRTIELNRTKLVVGPAQAMPRKPPAPVAKTPAIQKPTAAKPADPK